MHDEDRPSDESRPTALTEQLAEVLRAALMAAAIEALRPTKTVIDVTEFEVREAA